MCKISCLVIKFYAIIIWEYIKIIFLKVAILAFRLIFNQMLYVVASIAAIWILHYIVYSNFMFKYTNIQQENLTVNVVIVIAVISIKLYKFIVSIFAKIWKFITGYSLYTTKKLLQIMCDHKYDQLNISVKKCIAEVNQHIAEYIRIKF